MMFFYLPLAGLFFWAIASTWSGVFQEAKVFSKVAHSPAGGCIGYLQRLRQSAGGPSAKLCCDDVEKGGDGFVIHQCGIILAAEVGGRVSFLDHAISVTFAAWCGSTLPHGCLIVVTARPRKFKL